MSKVRGVAALLVAVAAVVALAAPAGAATPPDGWQGTSPGGYVSITVSPSNVAVTGRGGSWQPVTLTRGTNLSESDLIAAFGNWEPVDNDGDGVIDFAAWPSSWSAGGLQLQRNSLCPLSQSSCSYSVISGAGAPSFFIAGNPVIVNGAPVPDLDAMAAGHGSMQLASSLVMSVVVSDNLNPVQGSNGVPGHITLDASGTTDGLPGALQFSWVVTDSEGNTIGNASGALANVDLEQDGVYCISLTVTNPTDGFSQSLDKGCIFVSGIAAPTPVPLPTPGVQPGPTPNPVPGGGGIVPTPNVESGAGAVAPVIFAPPRRVPSPLFGGRNGEAQVIWLWRPDWFQETLRGPRSPQAAQPPKLRQNRDIVVSTGEPVPDSNATPWLAGLGVFGLFGAGWIIMRRRRVRAEL